MKAYPLSIGALLLPTLLTSCASDPETLQPDRNEEYSREFVKEFGVPATGHDFSMAVSAGLRITTSKGGQVIVTAEIDGTEYLFADLYLPAGTHPLPVTIPNTVTQLKVVTANGEQIVATDALVDIDKIPGASRAGDDVLVTTSGDFTIGYGENGKPLAVQDNKKDGPIVAFKLSDFLKGYFEQNPLESTKDLTDYTFKLFSGTSIEFSGETAFGTSSANKDYTYYLFPIWWRENSAGCKDYETYLHKQTNASTMPWQVNFGAAGNGSVPFPQLGYSTDVIPDVSVIDFSNLPNAFSFSGTDDGKSAYPLDDMERTTVVSRGVKLKFSDVKKNNACISVKSGIGENGAFTLSSSSPKYNQLYWGGKYFDAKLSTLFFASVSTKRTQLSMSAGNPIRVYNGTEVESHTRAYIVGFNSAPVSEADKSPRNYGDLLYLLIPVKNPNNNEARFSYLTTGYSTFEWTVAAEDLGGSDDWDFNDAVFSFTDIIENLNTVNKYVDTTHRKGPGNAKSVRVISVTPRAAGGTMPIYITYTGRVTSMPDMPSDGDIWFSDANAAIVKHMESAPTEDGTFIIGKELHKWLGASSHTSPLNVGSARANINPQGVKFVIPTEFDHNTINQYPTGTSTDNQPLYGFGILVDRENSLQVDAMDPGFRQMQGLTLGQGAYTIGKPDPNKNLIAPQMLIINSDWEWPQERVNIKEAYPGFEGWVANDSNTDWLTNGKNSSKVTKK